MFDRQVEESVEIVATPADVWWQLTSFDAYSDWNPFITRIEGELREGARLSVTMRPDGIPPVVVRPRIVTAEPERELRWLGRLGLPALFEGEHSFLIESTGIDRVRFTQRERFDGLLVPGTLTLIAGPLRRGFREMNHALRQRAEAAHATRRAEETRREAIRNDARSHQ